jgi:hypothetical protein
MSSSPMMDDPHNNPKQYNIAPFWTIDTKPWKKLNVIQIPCNKWNKW